MKKLFIPPVLVLVSFLLILLFYFMFPAYNWIPFPYNLTGIIIAFIGFVIMGKARDLFKEHNTTLGFDQATYLITEGIFSRTRNPMYLGMFILLLGIGIVLMNLFSLLTAFGFLLVIRIFVIPMEERLMQETFGQSYVEYKNKVSRWI